MGPAPDINNEFLPELLVNRALDRGAPALWGWAKTAAKELSTSGVTVSLVCPVCMQPAAR
jgi:hypothetical protein